MGSEENGSIRRIVVALDASPCSRLVLRTAARIAAGIGASLEGLFVEDIHLLQVADLPIAQEVIVGSATVRALNRPALERDYRTLAEQTEALATAVAREFNVTWRFHVRRGNVAQELMAAAGDGDLLSLGRLGWPLFPQPARLGSIARTVLAQHPYPLLLLDREIRPGQPVLVTFDGSAADMQRLSIAAQLSTLYNSRLLVLLQTASGRTAAALQRHADSLLSDRTRNVIYRRVESPNLLWQMQLAATEENGTLLCCRMNGLETMPFTLIVM